MTLGFYSDYLLIAFSSSLIFLSYLLIISSFYSLIVTSIASNLSDNVLTLFSNFSSFLTTIVSFFVSLF